MRFFRKKTRPAVEKAMPSDELIQEIKVSRSGLRKLNIRPPLRLYLGQLWERRFFIVADARYRAFRTAKSYNLWRFWLIAQPLLDAAMYGLIFGFLLKTSRGVDNFLGYLLLGVTFFGLMSSLMSSGQSLIQTSKNMIQTFSFPKAALVLSQSLRYMFDKLPSLLVAVVVGLLAQWGTPLSWTLLLLIPITLLIWIFGTGLMFFVARVTAFIPDFKAVVGIISRAWFFSSGVFFPLERFAHSPVLYKLFAHNPGYIFLDVVRGCVLYSEAPPIATWLTLMSWAFGTFFAGIIFFWQAEERYVDVRA